MDFSCNDTVHLYNISAMRNMNSLLSGDKHYYHNFASYVTESQEMNQK
jgi:hypothetical protein